MSIPKYKRITCILLISLPLLLSAEEATKSGYENTTPLEGPDGVAAELAADDVKVDSVFRPLGGFFQPWYALKREWNEQYGLQLGFSYNAMYQYADESLTGIDDGAAGRFQAQAMWNLVDRNGKNPGYLSVRVEDRHKLGTEIPASQVGQQFGSVNVTGAGFSEFDWAVTELAWRQTALDGKMKFGFGKISAVSWYNVHPLSGALGGFVNSSIRASGTKPNVGRGLGALTGFHLNPKTVMLAGVHDANAKTSENPFDTIDEGEFYYSVEFRYLPSRFEKRQYDQVRMQLWYVDDTKDGTVDSGYGAALTASYLLDNNVMPFMSAGYSEGSGAFVDLDATLGLSYSFKREHHASRDLLALGVNWANPSDHSKFDQITTEAFYKVQLFQNFAFTPSVQYIHNPSYHPDEVGVWLVGARGRLTF